MLIGRGYKFSAVQAGINLQPSLFRSSRNILTYKIYTERDAKIWNLIKTRPWICLDDGVEYQFLHHVRYRAEVGLSGIKGVA